MVNLISKTTSVELYKFFTGILKRKPVSKQAFSQAKKIDNQIKIIITTGRFSTKEIGIFITSLGKDILSRDEIVNLYRRRWEIETNFRHQKETDEFENFACKKNRSIATRIPQ